MRTRRGGGPEMNLAWNWRNYGSPASAQVGAIVVWRHHVGEIVGQAANGQWLVHSGNDGGAVRTRARSIAGAVIRM
jgi:ribosomal protein L35AE/L33A